MQRPRCTLDGFFHPSQALDVLRARAALHDAIPDALHAAPADASHGRVTNPSFVERRGGALVAQRGSIACEQIFGPLQDLACRCGKYRGAAHAGTTCEKCGVLCGSSALRDERFGHLELPGGVVHAALAAAIGALIGLDADEVRAVARCEAWLDGGRAIRADGDADAGAVADHADATGVHALRVRLAEAEPSRLLPELADAGFSPLDLLVDAAPVIPPGDRPLQQLHDPTVLAPQRGPVNEAYLALATRSTRLARLLELRAPSIVVRHEEALLQRAFDRAYDAVRGVAPSERPPWNEGGDPTRALRLELRTPIALDGDRWYPWRDGPPDPTLPCACLWLDDERLLLQFPYVALVVARADGRILAEHAVFGLTARSVDAAGRRVVFLGDNPTAFVQDGEPVLHDVAVLDTLAGRWLDRYPPELRAVTVVNEQPEEAFLADFRTGGSVANRRRVRSARPLRDRARPPLRLGRRPGRHRARRERGLRRGAPRGGGALARR